MSKVSSKKKKHGDPSCSAAAADAKKVADVVDTVDVDAAIGITLFGNNQKSKAVNVVNGNGQCNGNNTNGNANATDEIKLEAKNKLFKTKKNGIDPGPGTEEKPQEKEIHMIKYNKKDHQELEQVIELGEEEEEENYNEFIEDPTAEDDGFIVPKIISVVSLSGNENKKNSTHHEKADTVIDFGTIEEDDDKFKKEFAAATSVNVNYDNNDAGGHANAIARELDVLNFKDQKFTEKHKQQTVALSYDNDGNGNDELPACISAACDSLIHFCEYRFCHSRAYKKCGQCYSSYYCKVEHQKRDWFRHKNECTVFRIKYASNGQFDSSISMRNLSAGQVIFKEKPLFIFPVVDPEDNFTHIMDCPCFNSSDSEDNEDIQNNNNDKRWNWTENEIETWRGPEDPFSKNEAKKSICSISNPPCFGCLQPIEYIGPNCSRCSRCKLPLCSEFCEYSANHQMECNMLANYNVDVEEFHESGCFHQLYLDFEIVRVFQLYNDYQSLQDFYKLRLLSKIDIYKQSKQFALFSSKINTLVPISVMISGYNYELIKDIHSIITTLSFKPYLNSPFKALFLIQQNFLNICIPNTVCYVENEKSGDKDLMTLVCKAATSILQDEIITVDFLPTPYISYPFRRQLLKNACIECLSTCTRCYDQFGDKTCEIKCINCKVGFVTSENPYEWENSIWSCSSCQEEMSYSNIESIQKRCRDILDKIPKNYHGLTELYEFAVTYCGYSLNVSNELIIIAWSYIERILDGKYENIRQANIYSPDESFKLYRPETYKEFYYLDHYVEAIEFHLNTIRPDLWVDRGILFFLKFHVKFILSAIDYHDKKSTLKEYIQNILKSVKILEQSLQILQEFNDIGSKSVCKHIQDATFGLTNIKNYARKLLETEQKKNELEKDKNISRLTLNH